METKAWWQSKTIWTNVIAAIASLVAPQLGIELRAEEQVAILVVINLILRLCTKGSVDWNKPAPPPATALILAAFMLAPSFTLADDSDKTTSPKVTVNKAGAAEFVSFLAHWKDVTSMDSFGQAFASNVTIQAVYSFSSEGGLSSGGAAIAAPLVDLTFNIEDGVDWALHFGPAFVAGSDDTGVFTALEAAMWTDRFGPLLDLGRKAWKPLTWIPRQVDALYLFIGAGVETCGNLDAGHAVCISAGCGYKF